MFNYFSVLSCCLWQKQLLCLLLVPSPTCAEPQPRHTQLPPPAASQGKDKWQPNHTKCKQNNLSSKSTPGPTGQPWHPERSQDRQFQQLSRIHIQSPSKETTQALVTHTRSAEGLWESKITLRLLSRITVLRTSKLVIKPL